MLVSLNIIAALGLFMIVGGTYATAELIKEATFRIFTTYLLLETEIV